MEAQVLPGDVFLESAARVRDPKRDRTNRVFVQKAMKDELALDRPAMMIVASTNLVVERGFEELTHSLPRLIRR